MWWDQVDRHGGNVAGSAASGGDPGGAPDRPNAGTPTHLVGNDQTFAITRLFVAPRTVVLLHQVRRHPLLLHLVLERAVWRSNSILRPRNLGTWNLNLTCGREDAFPDQPVDGGLWFVKQGVPLRGVQRPRHSSNAMARLSYLGLLNKKMAACPPSSVRRR